MLAALAIAIAIALAPSPGPGGAGAAIPTGTAAPDPALEAEPTPIGHRPLRYDEDWSCLRDPRRKKDIFDTIKYIPLADGGDVWLTLGANLREQFEDYHNQDFGTGPTDDGYLLHRIYPFADLHFGAPARIFVMLKSCYAFGTQNDPFPSQENTLDLHQAFLDLALATPIGRFTLRPGRQELLYGSGRLIDNRSGPNTQISYDAARLIFERPEDGLRIDALYGVPIGSEHWEFDDREIKDIRIWGAYATRPLGATVGLDVYYLGIARHDHTFDEGTGDARRHALGARFFAARGQGIDWNIEASYQLGDFERGRINAWAANVDAGYTFDALPAAPRIGGRADIHSGDRHAGDGDLETFDSFFPRGILQGEAGSFGPANLAALTPEIVLRPLDPVFLSARWTFYWRQSRGDGIYSLNMGLLASHAASRERYIGDEISLTFDWYVERHTIISTVFSYTDAGPFLREAGFREDQAFVSVTLTVKF